MNSGGKENEKRASACLKALIQFGCWLHFSKLMQFYLPVFWSLVAHYNDYLKENVFQNICDRNNLHLGPTYKPFQISQPSSMNCKMALNSSKSVSQVLRTAPAKPVIFGCRTLLGLITIPFDIFPPNKSEGSPSSLASPIKWFGSWFWHQTPSIPSGKPKQCAVLSCIKCVQYYTV